MYGQFETHDVGLRKLIIVQFGAGLLVSIVFQACGLHIIGYTGRSACGAWVLGTTRSTTLAVVLSPGQAKTACFCVLTPQRHVSKEAQGSFINSSLYIYSATVR